MRYIPIILEIALTVYALVDCIQTPAQRIRNLPKIGWIALVVVLPFVGPIAWLLGGRPKRDPSAGATWSTLPTGRRAPSDGRPLAPDDDPDFIAKLKRRQEEQARKLKRRAEELKRRENELHPPAEGGEPETPGAAPPDAGKDA